MKITLSAIKADIGSIAGHLKPSGRLLEAVRTHIREHGGDLIVDHYLSHTGDDIAILMTHRRGEGDEQIHRLAWEAFRAGTAAAIEQGLYAAGHDLLKGFSGDIGSMGTVAAEMEFEERPSEPFLFFAADKTDQGAFNLPLYLAFADVMNTPGLILSPMMSKGFRFVITDVSCDEGDRVIELNAPEELYDIAALLRDPERYVVNSIWSRTTGEQAVSVATSRRPKYRRQTHTGKDDPVMLVRVQMNFPATGEVLAPYAIGHFVGGCMRGSHQMPLMPVPLNTPVSYFDGPPIVTCAGFAERHGDFTEPVDCFAHPFWDTVRQHVATKAIEMRRQGFFGAAMLPVSELEYTGVRPELEYTGIMAKLKMLDSRFIVRPAVSLPVPA